MTVIFTYQERTDSGTECCLDFSMVAATPLGTVERPRPLPPHIGRGHHPLDSAERLRVVGTIQAPR